MGRIFSEPEPSQATGMALALCILGKFLGVGCHFFPPPLDVSTFSARCLHVQRRESPPAAEGGTLRGREMFRQIPPRIWLPPNSMDLLHAANLRQETDSFTSPPKEGVLRIFLPLKIRRLRPSLNSRTWVPKASTIPLNHRSRLRLVIELKHRDVLCTTVCSESFRTADTINSVFVNLFLTMFFCVFQRRKNGDVEDKVVTWWKTLWSSPIMAIDWNYVLYLPNFLSDFNISSTGLTSFSYSSSIRNVVRYAWNTVLIATL